MTTTSARLSAAGRALLLVSVVSMAGDLGAAGTSPLVDAIKRGDVAAARQLARTKAAVNAADADGTVAKVVDRGVLSDPALTPDGCFVIYWKTDKGGEGGALYRAPLNGPDAPVNITAGERDNDAAVSPIGDLVAFTRAGERVAAYRPEPGKIHRAVQRISRSRTVFSHAW